MDEKIKVEIVAGVAICLLLITVATALNIHLISMGLDQYKEGHSKGMKDAVEILNSPAVE